MLNIYIYYFLRLLEKNYHKKKPKTKITVNKNIQEFGKRRMIENRIYS